MQNEIKRLRAELQKAINERNLAWFQLEDAGIPINTAEDESGFNVKNKTTEASTIKTLDSNRHNCPQADVLIDHINTDKKGTKNIMAKEYCPEYVKSIEDVAFKMAHALQLTQQLLTKKGMVSSEIVKSEVDSSVSDYFQLKSNNKND